MSAIFKTATILCVTILLFPNLPPNLSARESRIRFDRISIDQGLSNSSILCILQDSKGFMWFGTWDGLNKYDGYKFTVYRRDSEKSHGLNGNVIWSVYEDHEEVLWIGASTGLYKFDREKERFIRYQHDPDDPESLSHNKVFSIHEDHENILWIGTEHGGLNKFDRKKERFIRYQHDPDDLSSLSHNIVTSICDDHENVLWIGTRNGLNRFDREKGQFIRYEHDPDDPRSLSSNSVLSVYEDHEGKLWIGTGRGLNKFDRKKEQFVRYEHDPDDPHSLSNNIIRTVHEDHEDKLWIGTHGGLNKFDRKKEQFVRYEHDPDDPHSLSHNMILSVYEDRSDVLWIGTRSGGGLNKFDREKDPFVHYKHISGDPRSLSHNNIRSVYEDHDGVVWIGTSLGGLNKLVPDPEQGFDEKKDRFVCYGHVPGDPRSLSGNRVFWIYEDRENVLWIGTDRGLNKLVRNSVQGLGGEKEKFVRYQHDPDDPHSLSHNSVLSIYEDHEGMFWVGTWGGGLNRFDREKEQFIHYKHDPDDPASLSYNYIKSVYEDRSGALWIGTASGGLDKFDREKEEFVHYRHDPDDPRSLSNNVVMSVSEDHEGILWIGTHGGGLNRFDSEKEIFTHYTKKDGLPSDLIYGVLEDGQGNFWISTGKGLSEFDPRTGTFVNYDVKDGLQSNEFSPSAYCKGPSGRMYFGGINGLNIFSPSDMNTGKDHPHIPQIVITDFKLFNKSVSPRDEGENRDSPLLKSVGMTEEIELTYKDNSFSFEFAALQYVSPEKNQYAYMMGGFDKAWNYVDSTRRFATYTNLSPGKYVFMVRGSNSDGTWDECGDAARGSVSDKHTGRKTTSSAIMRNSRISSTDLRTDTGAAIAITITPPPWKTWWAYTIYFTGLACLILGVVWYDTKAQSEKLVRQQKELDRQRQIDKLKDEFLANTSHELRTPLNGIIGIADSMIDGAVGPISSEQELNLSMISSSGRRLANLVNDILDFSKLRNMELRITLKPVDVRNIAHAVIALSQPLIGQKAVVLLNHIPDDLPLVRADENRLQQILHNLIGNAVKFTHEGRVTVSAASENSQNEASDIRISVSDTGIGISEEKHESIFKSFEQADGSVVREYGGTGLGLSVTKQLLELHGSSIELESSPDKGSVFSFTLPAAEEQGGGQIAVRRMTDRLSSFEPETRNPDDESPTDNHPVTTDNRETVLIVDDEIVNIQVLRNHLSSHNYRVLSAQNGFQALQILRKEEPDIIILDLMMPRMSGYEVCRKIRETKDAASLPIVMLTAKNQTADLIRGLNSGANDYLTKPFNKEELLVRARTHLELKSYHDRLEHKVRERTLELNEALRKIMDSIRYAERIQRSLLPAPDEVRTYLPDSFFLWMPRDIVGGDIYFTERFEDGIIIAVVDCTGHGVPGAFMSMIASSFIRRITTIFKCHDPAEILRQLNSVIKTSLQQDRKDALSDDGLDAAVCFVSLSPAPHLIFAGARLPLFYVHNREVTVIKGDKQSIGYKRSDPDFEFTNHTVRIEKGMSFYMSTDGFWDQLGGERGHSLGKKRFRGLLGEVAERPFEEQREILVQRFDEYKGENGRQDDVTVAGFGF